MNGDRLISSQAELEEHILRFYQQLYQLDEQVENNTVAGEECFQFVRQTVTDEQNIELLKPLTVEEVAEAVKQLPKGKAPGIDAIPAEFYQELWEDIEFDIFNFASEAIHQAHISDDLNISKIALLPKTEDRARIQNFRPISLLNTLYKVLAKIYANRMKPLLHNWILPSQTGFVPNRCILDNIFLAFEAMEWSLENRQDLSMLLLDFEKAYDRVSWTFLKQTMGKMGFAEIWIQRVMSLNLNASAAIIVNGEQSKTFKLQRSVRQGCPLAPYLFLLTVDVLGQMLQHPGCNVKGLRLPDNTTITNQMFADDTLLLLDGTPDNMDRAIEVIKKFGAASGAKLNLHKSVGVWVAHNPRTWAWGEEEGLKWLQPGEVTRYLGYPFGLHIAQKEKDNKMLSQVRKHLHRWANNKLSLAGRIMVANQVILSSIWYLASCTDFSTHALKLVRATVRNYIWSGKKESFARARVKWATAVLPIVRGGVKILDPQWQASALLVKLLVRGMTAGYEPWKTLVRYRVAQTRQSRKGRWPSHANWMMNNQHLAKQGSSMWQGVMKAWNSIQSGLEQQAPTSWAEIMRQPLFGNRLLTSEEGVQWGTESRSKMRAWAEKDVQTLKDILRADGQGWNTFQDLRRLRRTRAAPQLYARLVQSIPWEATVMPPITVGQWLAHKEEDGNINFVYHIQATNPTMADLYKREDSEKLTLLGNNLRLPPIEAKETRVIQTFGPKHTVIDFNPIQSDTNTDHTLWMWGNKWIQDLQWDPKDWNWRRIGTLPDTTILNYTTKRGYRVALRQDSNQMNVDAEMEADGIDSKTRAKFFNRIWHPYLPRKVSALQWLILAEGLPVGAWREKLGLPGHCPLCAMQERETLQHAFLDCEEVKQAWICFRQTRSAAGLSPAYTTWKDVSRGLMTIPEGPSVEADLQWDTASAFSLNADTPWDILRAQLLWSIWRQRVAHAFDDEQFHIGLVLWHAWRNTIYCAIEAYKELHRHKRNEEKRQEQIACFKQIWTAAQIFGRLRGGEIKWHLTPHPEFLPQALGAWTATPIRINRLSPSPDLEAEFTAQSNFQAQVQSFLNDIGANWQPAERDRGGPSDSNTGNTQQQHQQDLGLNNSPPDHGSQAEDVTFQDQWPVRPPPIETDIPFQQTESNSAATIRSELGESGAVRHPLAPLNQHTAHRSLPFQPATSELLTEVENLNPHQHRKGPPPSSRPKTRCRYGPLRSREGKKNTEDSATERQSPSSAMPDNNPAYPPQTATHGSIKKSRPKIRCTFGPKVRALQESPGHTDLPSSQQENENPTYNPYLDPESDELDALLREIDIERRESDPLQRPSTSQSYNTDRHNPRSQETAHTWEEGEEPSATDPPLLDRRSQQGTAAQPCISHTFERQQSPEVSDSVEPSDSDEHQLTRLPDRVTLAPTRWDHIQRRARDPNLTEEEFDRLLTREINDLLFGLRAEHRFNQLFPEPPLQRILTQEDCLLWFQVTGPPDTPALYGVYLWAAGLRQAQYNFDFDEEGEEDFINALGQYL